MIEESDCDCEEFSNLKICGRCQVLMKLKQKTKGDKVNVIFY